MFALLSEEDLQFIFETQIPHVEAVDAKKRSLAKTFATGGKKKVTEALAAIPKLPEPSPADQAQFAASMRACASSRPCSHEDSCIARSATLLGCKFALLWHPEELQTSGQQCMSQMHGTPSLASAELPSTLPLTQLSAMWTVWIACIGGAVVASTAAGSAALRADSKEIQGSGTDTAASSVRSCPTTLTDCTAGACLADWITRF